MTGRKILLFSVLFLLATNFTINAYGDTNAIKLDLDKNEYIGLGDRINITITAPALNISENAAEHLALHVYTGKDPKGFTAYAQETETDSGEFKSQLKFSLKESDPKLRTLLVSSGTRIYIKYKELSVIAEWQPEDAEIKLDKKSYGGYGTRPVVTLYDNDLNLDPLLMEEININAASASDSAGITVKLTESKPDSGVFTGSFGLIQNASDDINKKLKVAYNDSITVTYNDSSCTSGKAELRTASSVWKPGDGTVKLNKSSYTGLRSTATASVTDQDLNLRPDDKDTARIRITSEADPQGFVVLANETGKNTGVFSGSFGFSSDSTDNDKDVIKVNPTDTITAAYIDERNSDNAANTAVTTASGFKFAEAKVETSAANDEGSGNMLDITINEPDANSPSIRDRIIAKAGSGSSMDDKTLYLEETGYNTGKFKCSLYLTGTESDNGALQVAGTDKINIKYTDNTVPEGGAKDIIKTVKWTYESTILKFDEDAYSGYNSPAKITLINMDLNKNNEKAEFADIKVTTSAGNIALKLKEESTNSGEFYGTLYFGKASSRSEGIVKVAGKDTVLISFTNKQDKNDTAECEAAWSPQDGQISLDRKEYKGNGAPVRITVKDWDLADNKSAKDEVKVSARVQGSSKYVYVTLTETYKNSGNFTGTLYINGSGSKKPSISLNTNDMLEVVYTDKDTSSGNAESRGVQASWGGISEAKLTFDKASYKGYDTYMTIKLNDPDQNLSTTARDKVKVIIKTKSGRTNMEYTLSETGSNTGIFSARLRLTEDAPSSSKVRVMGLDEISVNFKEKKVEAGVEFWQ